VIAARAAIVAALLVVLCAGLWLGGHPANLPEPLRDVFVDDAASLSAEATEVIEENYFRPTDGDRLSDSSIDGMVRALRRRYQDRFSHYFDPRDLERFRESISGRFSGVGLSVSEIEAGLRVGRVFPGAPAEEAGIAVGDVIVSVNGRSIAGEDSEVATAKIKGPAGTEVTIGVRRPPADRVRSVDLTRAEIEVPITTSRIRTAAGRKLGYVQLISFTEGAHAALREAIERVRDRGAEGLVLDLRGNGGGLLQEAVLTASIFLPEGDEIVSTRSRTQGSEVYRAVGENLPAQPTVVLINRDTASAAEILAAALADGAGAPLVGVRSFGKGVFQQVIDLSNGGALDLTIGEYFTPSGENLAGRGIAPDTRVLDDPRTRPDEALERALTVLGRELRGAAAPATGD
jgi:carboxyl-terminal processing protease